MKPTLDLEQVSALAKDLQKSADDKDEDKTHGLIEQISKLEKSGINLTQEVRDVIEATDGREFTLSKLRAELSLTTKTEKDSLRKIVNRLKKDGFVESTQAVGGYRIVLKEMREIKWWAAPTTDIPIRLPFDTHDLVKIFPGNLIVYSGVQNAGKSAAILDTIRMNLENKDLFDFYNDFIPEGDPLFNILNSEAGDSEVNERITLMKNVDRDKFMNNVAIYERSDDFAEVIKPNAINIIDFLELTDDFWIVGKHMKHIHEKMMDSPGIAIIAIQKNEENKLGIGGARALEKPRLYINIEGDQASSSTKVAHGRWTIVKAKNWKTPENPNNLMCSFDLVNGNEFIQTIPFSQAYYDRKKLEWRYLNA